MRLAITLFILLIHAACAHAQVGGVEWRNAGVRVCNTVRANATLGGITCSGGVANLPFVSASAVTLPNAYANGAAGPQRINLDATRLGIGIRDASPSIGQDLFYVSNANESSTYFSVVAGETRVTGPLVLQPTGSPIRFLENAANGTQFVGFQAPAAVAASVTWILPSTDGSAGAVTLQTNGAGTLSWSQINLGAVPAQVTGVLPAASGGTGTSGAGAAGRVLRAIDAASWGTSSFTIPDAFTVNDFVYASANNVLAGGPLTGDVTNVGVTTTVRGLRGITIMGLPTTNGQIMIYNGTTWGPSRIFAGTYEFSTDNSVTFGTPATTAATIFTRTVASRTPDAGAGVNLDLDAGDATSGNTNGGDIDLNIGKLSGTGAVGYVNVRNADDSATLFRVTQANATNGLVEVVGASVAVPMIRPATDNVAFNGDETRRWYATFSMAYVGAEQTPAFSATPSWDPSTNGETIKVTLTGNITSWTMASGKASEQATLILCQDGTGSRTWASGPANVTFSGGMPALTTTASKCDVFSFRMDVNANIWRETSRALNQ